MIKLQSIWLPGIYWSFSHLYVNSNSSYNSLLWYAVVLVLFEREIIKKLYKTTEIIPKILVYSRPYFFVRFWENDEYTSEVVWIPRGA